MGIVTSRPSSWCTAGGGTTTPPPTKYKCSGTSCVADPNGTYTTSNCNNVCTQGNTNGSTTTPTPSCYD
jgi:hypothetical protein